MRRTFDPFRLLLASIAGWLGQQQRDAIDYLREENRVLREQLGDKRLGLNDDQRRRLAAKAKTLGAVREYLEEACGEIFEEQLNGWYRVPSSWPSRRDLDAFDRWFE
jgi:alkylation response protein AidB-like acyl-CoA dehydrogenase